MRTKTSTAAARDADSTGAEVTLYMSIELSLKTWKVAFTVGSAQPSVMSAPARDYPALMRLIAKARERFKLGADVRVVSCYEAGREGFSVHRMLAERGIDSRVVNPASIRVTRQARRSKTDRLDAIMLVKQLAAGELKGVEVPTPEAEDARQAARELHELKVERGRLMNRIRGLLFAQGYDHPVSTQKALDDLDLGRAEGRIKLLPALSARLDRELVRLQLLDKQIDAIEKARLEALRSAATKAHEQMRLLMTLCGVGIESAWILMLELFGWRTFPNRKALGAFLGLAPTPHASGQMSREQGISKAGSPRLRALLIELAWFWLRYQPESELAKWYSSRFSGGTKRTRRVGIVALARKLAILLWHFLRDGVPPAGAQTRPDRYAPRPTSRLQKTSAAAVAA